MTEIKGFIHRSVPAFLPDILMSGKLSSPVARGQKTPSWYDGSYVYLTPVNTTEAFRDTHGVYFHFDATTLMRDYPKFFINNGNSYGPLSGKGTPGKECGCKWTYNTLAELDGECVKHTLHDMETVLKYDMSKCDGGPEIGFPLEITLLPYLKKITISKKNFESIKSKIPTEYASFIETFESTAGGKRKTKRRRQTKTRRNNKSY
jgi:hypothetical protein